MHSRRLQLSGEDMPDIDGWIQEIGRTGELVHEMGAAQGGAGSISLFLPSETTGLRGFSLARFPRSGPYRLSGDNRLPHGTLLISGTRRRLRDIQGNPDSVLCAIQIEPDGSAWLHRSKKHDVEPSSEIDSHANVHAVQLSGAPRISAVVHAQPPNLTYLTHIKDYRETGVLNRQLLRWQPETIAMIPNGIPVVPFETPGTARQGQLTRDAMVRHQIVLWAQHGVIARSRQGPVAAFDLIEYAEAAARYEFMDLQAGRVASGISFDEISAIAKRFNVNAPVLDQIPKSTLS